MYTQHYLSAALMLLWTGRALICTNVSSKYPVLKIQLNLDRLEYWWSVSVVVTVGASAVLYQ